MFQAAQGDTVKVRYVGRLREGVVFDASPPERPLHFIIGRQEVIPGFDEALLDMVPGEKKTVVVPPDKAYGAKKPELVEEVERTLLPGDLELKVGAQLEVTRQDGSRFHVMVRELSPTEVTLDANHPLAGQELIFDIELLEVKKPQAG